jgi:hypothetical protein
MHKLTFIEPHSRGKRIFIELPRVPIRHERILIGDTEYKVEMVRFCCGEDQAYTHTWLEVSEVGSDVEDVLEDS